jgi:excinuclease ABC subunit B
MERAIDETNRRREKQLEYNREHRITPRSIVKSIEEVMLSTSVADAKGTRAREAGLANELFVPESPDDPGLVERLEAEMRKEAEAMRFEKAASIRDRIEEIRMNQSGRRTGGRSRKISR